MKNKLSLFASLLVLSIVFFACEKKEPVQTSGEPINYPPYDINQGAHIIAPDLTWVRQDPFGFVMYELTLEPGDTLPWHEHPPHTLYILEEGTLELLYEDSTKTSFYSIGETNFGLPSRYMAINTGETTIKMIIHDLYYLAPEELDDPTYNESQGAHIIAPDLTEVLEDKRGVVMYVLTMEPGDLLDWHDHPKHTIYIIEEGTLEVYHGTSSNTSFYPIGKTNFGSANTDLAVNTGETTIKVLVHELYSLE